jgi:hypothetical protein
MVGKESSSFSAEKEPKRLPLLWSMGCGAANAHAPEYQKFFGSFFQKRTASLPFSNIHLRFQCADSTSPLTQQRTCLCHIFGSWLRNDVKRSGSTMEATPLWLVRWTVL